MVNMKIRLYKINDLEKIMSLYYDTVHSINANDYTEEQLDAMAPGKPNVYHWETQLNKNHTLVAVDNQDTIIGFGNMQERNAMRESILFLQFHRYHFLRV